MIASVPDTKWEIFNEENHPLDVCACTVRQHGFGTDLNHLCQELRQAAHRTKQYLITDFGAVADSKTVNTKAIQAAIDKCAATKKGGVVVVPAGTFRSGAIFLKQGVDLLVEKDGVLKGTTNLDDYPQIQSRWEGTEEMYTSSLRQRRGRQRPHHLRRGHHRRIGRGVDGKQSHAPAPARRRSRCPRALPPLPPLAPPPPATLRPAYGRCARGRTRRSSRSRRCPPGPRQMRGRPRLIGIQNSKEVLVSGLQLHNQAIWCLFVLYSEDVEIDGVNITAAHNIPSSDGIDIDSSKHVHVTNAFIDDDDDCISIKAGKDADGLRVNRPADDILIENSHFAYGQGGVAMGSESSGGIRNVTVQNCLMDSDNWTPIRFKSQPSRGGVVENITYKNIVTARHARGLRYEHGVAHGRPANAGLQPLARCAQRQNHQRHGRRAERRLHSWPCRQLPSRASPLRTATSQPPAASGSITHAA